jgi:hypothetical protein
MATERLPLRNIREILRLKWTWRRSHVETARSLVISAGTVASVVTRAKAVGLTSDTVEALSDDALARKTPSTGGRQDERPIALPALTGEATDPTGSIGKTSRENVTQRFRPDHSPKSSAVLQTKRG